MFNQQSKHVYLREKKSFRRGGTQYSHSYGNKFNTMKDQRISDELKHKFFCNQCTSEEHSQALQWMKSASSKEKSAFMDEHAGFIASGELKSNLQTDLAFEQVEQKMKTVKMAKRYKLVFRRAMQVAAAIVLLIAGFYSYMMFSTDSEKIPVADVQVTFMEHKAEYGQQSNVRLSDGSQVKLNAGTKITYPEKFSSGKREIAIRGQAFFDVARDPERPFIINTGKLQVTVLGTSFDVNSFEDDNMSSITVMSGKVRVSIDGRTETILLSKNEQLVYNKETISYYKQSVSAQETIAWIKGILRFEDAPLTDVFRQLERWYNVEIRLSGNVEPVCTVSGQHKNEGLTSVLDALKFSHGVQYTYVDDNVVINKIDCE